MKLKLKWNADGVLLLDSTIVGSVEQGAGRFFASGCLDDWQDVNLGSYPTMAKAKKAVTDWVREEAGKE